MKKRLFICVALLSLLVAFKIERKNVRHTFFWFNKMGELSWQSYPGDTTKKLTPENNKSVIPNVIATVPSGPTPGGFVPVLRYYNSQLHKHFFTTNSNELGNGGNGWVYEKVLGWIRLPVNGAPSNINRFYNSSTSAHYYTPNTTASSGFVFEWAIGNVDYIPYLLTLLPVTEYYNPTSHDYIYVTTTAGETLAGYTSDGVVTSSSGVVYNVVLNAPD